MNVWAVYEHDYDNSGIRGVFDSLRKAELYVEQQEQFAKENGYNIDLEIQTWEVL